jgi:hypothetical protein
MERDSPDLPPCWLLVEALEAHSQAGKRILDDLTVVDSFPDGVEAMKSYKELHHRAPERELYVLHTDREELDIGELIWLGPRPFPQAAEATGFTS